MSRPDDSPVTVSVVRRVKPGCEAAFEEVLLGIIAAAMSFNGHFGVNVFRPTDAIPLVLRTLILTGLLVPLMIYVVMPWLTKRCKGWLYPRKRSR